MVKHVLKDGRKVSSVKGMTVKKTDCPGFYAMMERIASEKKK